MNGSVSLEEAIKRITDVIVPIRTETEALELCFSRVLAEDVFSAADVPPFDRSPYDGYALRSEDVANASAENPVTLEITEEIPAGGVPECEVTQGKAAKILTGAPIPQGADAVIMFEKTEFSDKTVTLFNPVRSGDNIVRRGEDIKKGEVIALRGKVIDAGTLGTIAAQNKTQAEIYKKPVVGLISTGSELIEVGRELTEGKIYDSNKFTLIGALNHIGCVPKSYGTAGDNAEEIANALEKALAECDAVVLTGGVSVGDYDLTPKAMEQVGVEILFRGCAIKPGMACAYGIKEGKPVCALSGNPASSITNFMLIARPALLKLAGRADYIPNEIITELADDFGKKSPCMRILRGTLDLSDGTAKMKIPHEQGNVVLSSTIGCDVMAIVPAGSGKLSSGEKLKAILI